MRSQLKQLLEEVKQLPKISQRKVGCLVGAAVADAAARPMHWVYDVSALQQFIKTDPDHPEFWQQSKSPFYTLDTGDTSCYWDQAQAVMISLNKTQTFNFDNICQELVTQFGPGSVYNMEARQEYMQRRMQGMSLTPVEGKWLHGGMIKFLENLDQGLSVGDGHVKETDGFCCSLPLVVKYAGDSGLVDMITQVTKTQSTWSVAVNHSLFCSKIIESFILGQDNTIDTVTHQVSQQCPEIAAEMEVVKASAKVPHVEAVGRIFGRPCYNPGSPLGALHAVMTSSSFEEAVRKTIVAGGCNCSRSFFIGAMIGARDGIDAIPVDWMEKTKNVEDVINLAMNITK